jgi:putative ABC transport system permease protein
MTRGRRRSLDDLPDDIRDHLERETQDNIDRGMTPEDARDAARRSFGNIALATENTRAVWIPIWCDQVMQDVHYGARTLRRSPAFSAIVIVTLALGIGLTTAVFSVVNAVMVRPLSYPAADRLVWVATYDDRPGDEFVASPDFAAWLEQSSSFDRLAGFFVEAGRIDVGDEVVQARIAEVTDGFWELAGAHPEIGRVPRANEEGIVLSRGFFERRFRGDPSIVGRPVVLDDRPTVVTGVLPAGFHAQLPPPPVLTGISPGPVDFYRAAIIRPLPAPGAAAVQLFNVLGWLKPGVTIARAHDELSAIRSRTAQAYGRMVGLPHLRLAPYADVLVCRARRPLLILLAAVVFVLLIACANVANLLLARGSARQREVAIRTAIGAGRGRMVRQFFVESLLLAAAGGAAGLLLARLAIATMLRLVPLAVPRLTETVIDGRVLAFAAATSIATAIVFACAPALALWNPNVYGGLKDSTRTTPASVGGVRGRTMLVAAELAMSVVLLVGAGLMMRSFWRLTAYPPGFAPERVLTMQIQLSGPRYRDIVNRRGYVDELLRRARNAPGVEAAGVNVRSGRILLIVEGAPEVPRELRPNAVLNVTSASYADAIGMRIVKGRWIRDDETGPVYVMSEALVQRYFPGQDPIGLRVRLPWVNDRSFATVVGVVADLRYSNLDVASEPELFTDYRHANLFGLTVAMRTAADPAASAPAIGALLSGVDRSQPLFDIKPLETVLSESIAPRWFNTLLLGTFAASALVLTLIGIYGVVAYSVAQRTHEIGVRMALGAQPGDVVQMVVRQGMGIAAAGILVGIGAALVLTRVLTNLLYEVAPTDAPTFVVVIGLLGAAVFASCCGPALTAVRVDPIVALRSE